MAATSARRGARGRTGRRRGQPGTREVILDAARGLFAAHGFAGTSIRAVAGVAGVDPALVHHYFGTKEGLFRAALEVPIDPAGLVAEIAESGPEDAPRRLVETFIALWDSPENGPAIVSFLRRVLAEEASTDLLRDFLGTVLLRDAAAVLLEGTDPDSAETRISLVASQLLGLVVVRKVLALEPLASLPPGQVATAVAPTVARYLRDPDLLDAITATHHER